MRFLHLYLLVNWSESIAMYLFTLHISTAGCNGIELCKAVTASMAWNSWNWMPKCLVFYRQLLFQNDLLSDDPLSWKAKILAGYQLILRQCPILHIQSTRFPLPREEFARWKILVLNKFGIVLITPIYISLCSRECTVIQGKC